MLTVQEAAAELGTVAQTIYNALNEGRLPFEVRYGRKLISQSAVEEYRQRTRPDGEKPTGRPKKKPVEPTAQ